MDITAEVNRTKNNYTEELEEAASVGNISTVSIEVMYEMECEDPGSPRKRLKTFVPPEVETIAYPVIAKFVSNLQ